MNPEEVKKLIEAGLPDAQVEVLGDDGQHFEARVVSPAFAGKSLLAQHRMVKATLKAHFDSGELHAMSLKTSAPE